MSSDQFKADLKSAQITRECTVDLTDKWPFTRNVQFWVDSDVQAAEVAKTKRNRIAFNSNAYFNLLAMDPKVAQWLALGRNVQFVLDNTIYEIYEETKNADN